MGQLSVLNRLILYLLPFGTEEPIIEVDDCFADEVITKQIIVIECFNHQVWCSREFGIELVHLKELWIRLIQLIVASFIVLFVAASQFQIWI